MFKWLLSRGKRPADAPGEGGPLPDMASRALSAGEKGWLTSSIDLHDGLEVVEDADVTVPMDLDALDGPRRRNGG